MSSPFDLPTDLKQWDYETVYQLVSGETYEPGIFDFKETLKARGSEEGEKEHIKIIRKVIGSMANTNTGGFIIFGVLDRLKHPNKTTEERIVGIEDGDLRKEFDDKQKDSIHPHVYFETCPKLIKIRHIQGKGVFVVRILPSPRRPHMVTIEERTVGKVNIFYRRGDGGTAIPMSYYEVRDQMMYTEERLRKVTLFRLEIAQYRLADICDLLPTSTDLLSKLLGIPISANLINEFLEQSTYPGLRMLVSGQPNPNVAYKEAIVENLTLLDQRCQICEQELERLFGHLGEH